MVTQASSGTLLDSGERRSCKLHGRLTGRPKLGVEVLFGALDAFNGIELGPRLAVSHVQRHHIRKTWSRQAPLVSCTSKVSLDGAGRGRDEQAV